MMNVKSIRHFFLIACLVLFAYSLLSFKFAQASSTAQLQLLQTSLDRGVLISSSVFQPVLTRLQKETKVPLRLPTDIASKGESSPIYAVVAHVTPSEYQIFLAYTQECEGENFCRYGTVTGEVLSSRKKTITGESVLLADGIQGYFQNAECHAYCTDSVLSWEENGYRYSVGIKAAKKETLIRVANSALEGA